MTARIRSLECNRNPRRGGFAAVVGWCRACAPACLGNGEERTCLRARRVHRWRPARLDIRRHVFDLREFRDLSKRRKVSSLGRSWRRSLKSTWNRSRNTTFSPTPRRMATWLNSTILLLATIWYLIQRNRHRHTFHATAEEAGQGERPDDGNLRPGILRRLRLGGEGAGQAHWRSRSM